MKSLSIVVILMALILTPLLTLASETDTDESSSNDDISISFNSKPTGATISVKYKRDSVTPSFKKFKIKDSTPLNNVPMKAGICKIEGKLKGYEDVKIEVNLEEGIDKDVVLDFAGHKKDGWFSRRSFWTAHIVIPGTILILGGIIALGLSNSGPTTIDLND